MAEESDPILAGSSAEPVGYDPIYEELYKKKGTKVVVGVSVAAVALFVVVSIVILAIKSAMVTALYVLVLINLLGIAQTVVFMVIFVYRGWLAKSCVWAIPVVSAIIIAESISTDILAFSLHI